jgi:hypothetical protein
LNEAEKKINNYSHRKACKKIEDYFYQILTPKGKDYVNESLKNKKYKKIDLYFDKLREDYPHLFKEGNIDWYSFLIKVNNFRINNNDEIHDKAKVNYESLVKTLNSYYIDENINFDKPLGFMCTYFDEFKNYLFDEKYILDNNLYKSFVKKEEMARNA